MLKSKGDSKSSSSASRSSSKLRDSKKKDILPAPIDEATSRQQRGELQEVASRAYSQAASTPRSGNADASRATSSDEEWLDQMTQIGVAPMIAKAHIKHRHDMPDLMRDHSYGWVAYQGDKPLEIGASEAALYHKYLGQGIGLDELVVLGIGPELPSEIQVDELLDF
jgi:hypothetical protein